MYHTNTTGICLWAGHFDLTSKLNSLLYPVSLSSDPLILLLFSVPKFIPRLSTMIKVCRINLEKKTFPEIGTYLPFYQLHYFWTVHLYTYYLHNTTCLTLLTAPIPTVDTSPHWFMSLNHQSSESFNSSSSSHYSSTIFAWHTDLRKLVGKRSLKPHKAVLFLSPQFNQSRHRSNTKPQLNFLQAKYWTKKKKKRRDRGKHLWQQAHQQPTVCICIIINLLCQIWFSWRADIPYKKHTLQITEDDDSFHQCWKTGGKGRICSMLLLRVAQCRNFFDLYQMRKELRSKQFHPFKTQWAKFPTSMKCCISTEIDGVTPVWLRTWLCMSVHSAMIALDVQLRTSICF